MISCKGQKGFTLAEMMIAVAISGIVLGGVYTAFVAQRQNYDAQEQVTDVQQSSRASMYLMTREIRLAGYDPTFSRNFGITEIKFRDLNNAEVTPANGGNSAIIFTLDVDDVPTGGMPAGSDIVNYRLYDSGNGTISLGRAVGAGNPQPVADNVIAMGLAYAYDSDGDGNLDTYAAGGSNAVIWAIDSDNNNTLNLNLDTDADGDIDEDDDSNGDGIINGTAIASVVALDKIRAVKIWLLVRSFRQDAGGFVDTKTYVVGNRVITPNTNFRHRLLHTTVYCRNLGLN